MRRFSDVNYYKVLGVVSSATRDQIRTAYRTKVRTAHPDHGGDTEQFAIIAEAWEVLGNESEREYYDADRRLKARAARPYAPHIDRDPATGNWSTAGAAAQPPPASAFDGRVGATGSAGSVPDDGLTAGQRWKKNKRRL